MNFEVLNSENVYQGRAFDVRRDQVRLPDGRATWLDIVDHPGAITILPIDAHGNVWFVRQYRHAAGQMILELPAGTLEAGEEPQAAALREIREEIGMRAGKLVKIGEFFLAPGYSTEYMVVYLATELSPAPLTMDDDEFLSVEQIPLERVWEMIPGGEIKDAKSLAALSLAWAHLP